jgi:phage terminase large subunit
MKKRLRIVQGGSSAGKTIAILLILIDRAQREKGKLISVVSETMPHLKRGVEHDFEKLTYKDNEGLPETVVTELESRKNNKYFWTVYGLGEIGEIEGKIFNNWYLELDEIPREARLERYGLDFGYTNDPSAIVAVYYYNGGYIWDEVLFAKGMSNKQLADVILNQPRKALVVADSAEPKSIDELRANQINVIPTTKGPGSVRQRIQMVQDQQISVTKRSLNIIKAYKNYMWAKDKDGRFITPAEPEHIWSHSMDAGTYAMSSLVPMIQRQDMLENMPRLHRQEKPNPAR